MTMTLTLVPAAVLLVFLGSVPAGAQDRPPVRVEGQGGYAVFGDEGAIDHGMFGASLRWMASRISVGPDFTYMIGPGRDRDLFVMGGVNIDLLRRRRVTPYVTTGAGFMGHSDERNSWTDFAFVVGGGARILVGERLFVAPEYRMGYPIHARLAVGVGYDF